MTLPPLDLPGGLALEWSRPEALLLIPIALIFALLARRSSLTRPVSTTWPWRQWVTPGKRRLGSLLLLSFLASIACALAEPSLWKSDKPELAEQLLPQPMLPRPVLPIVRVVPPAAPGEHARVEVIVPPGERETQISIETGDRTLASERIQLSPAAPVAWQRELPLPAVLPTDARVITVRLAEREWRFSAASEYRPRRVEDRTGSAAIAAALRALEDERWIELVASDPDILIARRGGSAKNSGARILLPALEAKLDQLLPVVEETIPPHPLLAGLGAEEWSIARAERLDGALADVDGSIEPILMAEDFMLAARAGDEIHFAFHPEESDLPERAIWPVLLGRMLLLLSPEPPPPRAAPEVPHRLPEYLAVLVAFLCAARLSWTGRAFARLPLLVVVLALLGLALLPLELRIGGTPAAATLRATDEGEGEAGRGGEREQLLAAMRELPSRGGFLQIPARFSAPLDEEELLLRLRERRISLRIAADGEDSWIALPRTAEVGSSLAARVRGAHAGDQLCLVTPSGEEARRIQFKDAEIKGDISFDREGVWSAQLTRGGRTLAESRVEVRAPPRILMLGASPASSVPLPAALTKNSSHWDPAQPLARMLPEPAARGVACWADLDPALLGAANIESLGKWMERGGTLLIAAGPPFYRDSESKTRLSALLPAPLPKPPVEEEVDLGIVLIDLSGSMREKDRSAIVNAGVRALLETTPARGRWGVAGFRDSPVWILPPGSRIDAAAIERFMRGAGEAAGGTRLDRGLDLVLAELARGTAGSALVVLSDGNQSGADWNAWGEKLARANVKLFAMTIGTGPDTTLRTLAERAGGKHFRLQSKADAARALREVVPPQESIFREVRGTLRRAIASPLLANVPPALPAPKRRVPLTLAAEAEILLVDEAGEALLASRRAGQGRAILWLSGWDAESFSAPPASTRLAASLGAILEAAASEAPIRGRQTALRVGAAGEEWLTVERMSGEPLLLGVERVAADGSEGVHELAIARGSDFYALPLPNVRGANRARGGLATLPAALQLEGIGTLPVLAGDREQNLALQEFVARTRGFAPPNAALAIAPLIYVALWIIGFLSLVGWRFPQRAAPWSAVA